MAGEKCVVWWGACGTVLGVERGREERGLAGEKCVVCWGACGTVLGCWW